MPRKCRGMEGNDRVTYGSGCKVPGECRGIRGMPGECMGVWKVPGEYRVMYGSGCKVPGEC